MNRIRLTIQFFTALVVVVTLSANLAAQDAGGGGGTGGTGTGGGTVGGGTTGGTGTNTGNTFGGGGGLQLPDTFDLTQNLADLSVEIPEFEDNRNQGFVGVTGDKVEERGFVGGLSQFAGGSSEGSFGGGVNSSSGRSAAGGRSAGRGGGGGTQLGFEVVRPKYIRARMRPAFNVQRPVPEQVAQRFVSHVSRLPQPLPAEKVQIRIENGVATISGTVENAAQAEKLERQLRLEPGVYRIANQLKIKQ